MLLIVGTAAPTNKARMAIEQTFGYMCWDAQTLGILTTYWGWVLLRRENGGVLYMSRMMGFNPSLVSEGYIVPDSFTLHHLLYWFTHETQKTVLTYEGELMEAVVLQDSEFAEPRVMLQSLPNAPSAAATSASDPTNPMHQNQPSIVPGVGNLEIIFHPWDNKTWIGQHVWSCQVLGELSQEEYVIKIWDGYRNTSSLRDNEWATYCRLHPLWDLCVPKPLAKGKVDFMHALIIRRIRVCAPHINLICSYQGRPLSMANWDHIVGERVVKAYDAIHLQGVIHGDVRLENILVTPEKRVWIIDFEFSRLAGGMSASDEIEEEKDEVRQLLKELSESVEPGTAD